MARTLRPNPARGGYTPVNHPPSSSSNRGKIYGIVGSVVVVVAYFVFMTGGGGETAIDAENAEYAAAYPNQAMTNNLRGSDSEAPPDLDSVMSQDPVKKEDGPSTGETDGESKAGFDEYDSDSLKEDEKEVEVAVDVAKMEIEELVEEEAVIDTEMAIEDKIDQTRDVIFSELSDILKDLDISEEKKSTEFAQELTSKIVDGLKDEIDEEIVLSGESIMEEKADDIDEVVAEDSYLGVSGAEEKLDVELTLEDAKTDIAEEFKDIEENIEAQLEDRTEEKMQETIKAAVGVDVDVHKVVKDKKRKKDNEEIDYEVSQAKVIMEEAEEEEVMLAEMDIDMILEGKKNRIISELKELFDKEISDEEVESIATRIIEKVREDADKEIEEVAAQVLEDKEAEMDRAIEDDKRTGFFTKEEVEDEVDEIEEETLDKVEKEVTAAETDVKIQIDTKIDKMLKKEIIEKAKKDDKKEKKSEEEKESEEEKKSEEETESEEEKKSEEEKESEKASEESTTEKDSDAEESKETATESTSESETASEGEESEETKTEEENLEDTKGVEEDV